MLKRLLQQIITGLSTRMTNKGFSDVELQLGVISIALAIVITLIIDKWAETRKKEELELIDKTIDDRARQIAEEKVLEYLREIENE